MNTPVYHRITIERLADTIRPGFLFPDQWLNWPPDIFALTSLVMQRTGCYRICLIEPTWWEEPGRNKSIRKESAEWMTAVGKHLAGQGPLPWAIVQSELHQKNLQSRLAKSLSIIHKHRNLDLYNLRNITSDPIDNFPPEFIKKAHQARELAQAIVELHALADMACCGLGLIDRSPFTDPHAKLAQCLANLLLTATGSLSTIDKMNGIVLPKLRTPQQGQMLRSMSHHLTFHITEAEVVWRTIPWLNGHQRTINVLAVPIPYSVNGKDFTPIQEKNHPSRYFVPRIEKDLSSARVTLLGDIVRKVEELKERIGRVHILVFPEIALTKKEYDFLLYLLFIRRNEIGYLPVVVAGVVSETEVKNTSLTSSKDRLPHNEVKIASFFSGRWYDMSQRKHHRWRLDRHQLMQYELASRMPTDRYWFEYMSTSQRRLTILAPNSWLSLTALICEDLARLEPVSELIRGIGPTFLTALLSDGPQITNRWPARYASVFAEDPGTAVLSLTSLGMTKRAKRLPREQHQYDKEPEHFVVGLWRDTAGGPRQLTVPNNDNQMAILLTLSAKFHEEYTLDGRSDGETASAFELDTYFPVTLRSKESAEQAEKAKPANWDIEVNALKSLKVEANDDALNIFTGTYGDWNDIRELTSLIYVLDCVIETKGNFIKLVTEWLEATYKPILSEDKSGVFPILFGFLNEAFRYPIKTGLGTRQLKDKWPAIEIREAIKIAKQIFNTTEKKVPEPISDILFYKTLFGEARDLFHKTKVIKPDNSSNTGTTHTKTPEEVEKLIKTTKELRIVLSVPIAIMILIDSKLANWWMPGFDTQFHPEEISTNIQQLRKEIEQFLQENYNNLTVYPHDILSPFLHET